MKKILTIILFAALTAATLNAQTIRYVKQGGAGDGSSWANASGSLQEMINASAAGDEVWVDAGIYKPTHTTAGSNANPNNRNNTFLMKAGVKIYGGFGATETSLAQRNLAGNKSILSGDIDGNNTLDGGNAYRVVTVSGDMGNALLDGFTITGGCEGSGAGINADGVMKFSNLIITGNRGGSGSGVCLSGAGSVFTNTVIAGNSAPGDAHGGGIYVGSGTHYMTNVTIVNNGAKYGGAIRVASGTLNLRNSIIWGNSASVGIINANGTVNHSNNLLQGGTLGNGIVAILDPSLNSDYSLQVGSPAINMGDKTLYDAGKTPDISGITTDISGNPRISECQVDLGAYEAPAALTPTAEGRVYVKQGATGKGSSWDDAYPNLAYPLRMASICGITEIFVAAGTYYPMYSPSTTAVRDKTFLMVAGVKIYGGFNATLTGTTDAPPFFGSESRKGVSILSGDIDKDGVLNTGNVYRVVTVSGDMGNALLDGFTVTETYEGGGINASGIMTFSNLIIKNNRGGYGCQGGGIYMSGAGSTFTNIVIADNSFSGDAAHGGG
ncbi:MAG: right-handed parallel beta-helix repeat-containing protein, partial [Prevotellaceae bacterium]|nr:right-handed parallel beta-helix repeat-containing protein [Prevotellaceae bacterium]